MIPRIDTVPVGSAAVGHLLAAARGRAAEPPAPGVVAATLARAAGAPRLEQLARGALAVTTGQQPGLLGGPLYSLYKGLAAAALAARLESELDRPVVPVFWVAGDDHDFHEANSTTVLTVENELINLVLRERPAEAPLLPLAREPVGPEIQSVLEGLSDATPDTEFKGEVLDWLARCYRSDISLADAFAEAMADLLGSSGVVILRAYAGSAKSAAAPLIIAALRADAHRLARPGPVDSPRDATLVMVEGRLGRDRLMQEDGTYHARRSGERWSLSQLEVLAEQEPERLSPNVLLRPVVEAALLPTVAYIAGPSELAYLPQAAPIYEALGVPQQPAVPRFGARIVEGRVLKVLEKFALAPADLSELPGPLEARLVKGDLPPATLAAFAELYGALEHGYPTLADAVSAVDPTMRKPVESAQGSAIAALKELEKRLVHHLKRRNETLLQQIAKARVNLFPRGRAQERVFGWPMYGIRYGDALREALWQAARAWAHGLPLEAPSVAA